MASLRWRTVKGRLGAVRWTFAVLLVAAACTKGQAAVNSNAKSYALTERECATLGSSTEAEDVRSRDGESLTWTCKRLGLTLLCDRRGAENLETVALTEGADGVMNDARRGYSMMVDWFSGVFVLSRTKVIPERKTFVHRLCRGTIIDMK